MVIFQWVILYDSCVNYELFFTLTAKIEENTFSPFNALLFPKKKKNAVETAKKICAFYENGAVAESIICKWVTGFGSGNFDLGDGEGSRSPNEHWTFQRYSTYFHMGIVKHLKSLWYMNR